MERIAGKPNLFTTITYAVFTEMKFTVNLFAGQFPPNGPDKITRFVKDRIIKIIDISSKIIF